MMYKICMKRTLDLFIVILLMIPFLIVCCLIAVLIKLDSKGGVLFKQTRLGTRGQEFYIYKFRTMVENAESVGTGIFTSEGDPRITKVGNLLRKTSLDELPQILNIIKGEMSFVGPRPPVPYHPYKYHDYGTRKQMRFLVKPGVTGMAQAYGRNTLTWDERIEYDIEYVENVSFLLDCKIVLKTIRSVIRKENIYREK